MSFARQTLTLLLLLPLCAVPSTALRSQEAQSLELNGWVGLGHNLTDNIHGHISSLVTWHYNPNIDLSGGLRWRSPQMLAVQAAPTIKFPLKRGELLLQTRFLYQAWFNYNIQEFNTFYLAGYSSPRWKILLGTFNKFFSNIHTPFSNREYIFEPLNFAYDLEFWVLRSFRKWNFSLRLCNIDDFQAERFFSPLTIYTLRYRPRDGMTFYASLRNHHAGIFDLTQNYYELSLNIGTIISW